MKYLVVGLILISSAGAFFACSGTVEDANEEGDDRSLSEICADICHEMGTCFGDSGSGLSSEEIRRDCRRDCADAGNDAREAGCSASYQDVMECAERHLTCRSLYGSGDDPCEETIDRYYQCVSRGSGSGYYSGEGS